MPDAPVWRCRACQTPLDPDWLDDRCAPCLDRLYTDLAAELLEAFLSRYRGQMLHKRVIKGESRWWLQAG